MYLMHFTFWTIKSHFSFIDIISDAYFIPLAIFCPILIFGLHILVEVHLLRERGRGHL